MKFEILDFLKQFEIYGASVYRASDSIYNIDCRELKATVAFCGNPMKSYLVLNCTYKENLFIEKRFILGDDQLSRFSEIHHDLRFLLRLFQTGTMNFESAKCHELSIHDLGVQLLYSRNRCKKFNFQDIAGDDFDDCKNRASNFVLKKLGCFRHDTTGCRFHNIYNLVITPEIESGDAEFGGEYFSWFGQYDECQQIINDWMNGEGCNSIGNFREIDFHEIRIYLTQIKSIDLYA
tara:strand:+ start:802 stop:1506 length:705 start_codon:yes stop_codon:yes gene_type:complete